GAMWNHSWKHLERLSLDDAWLRPLAAWYQRWTRKEETRPGAATPADDLSVAMLDYDRLQALVLPPSKVHLEILREGSLVMPFVPRGVGKTLLCLGITAALVTGTPFMKWPLTAPVGVLYVDGEMPLDDLRQRLRMFLTVPLKAPLFLLSSEMVFATMERD